MERAQISIWGRLARVIAGHPWRVVVLWLVACGASVPGFFALQHALAAGGTVAGTRSARVDRQIAETFGDVAGHSALVVLTGVRPYKTPADAQLLKTTVTALLKWPQVLNARSALDLPTDLLVGKGGSGAIIAVQFRPGSNPQALEGSLRRLADKMARPASGQLAAVQLSWTGPFFARADVVRASRRGARRGEIAALPLTLLFLVAILGSVRAALCPVLCAAAAVTVGYGCAGLAAVLLPWAPSALTQTVISLIGLALTIDYSLLTVNLFRQEAESGRMPREAVVAAVCKSAPTIVVAGCSVFLGFAAMLIVPIDEIRSIGAAGALASAAAVLASTTLLPVVFLLLAPGLVDGRGLAGTATARRFFAKVSRTVCARPAVFLLVAAAPLVLLALPVRGLQVTAHSRDWLPADAPSTRGLDALQAIGRGGVANQILVVAEAPPGQGFLDKSGWAFARTLQHRLAALDNVETVIGLPQVAPKDATPKTLKGMSRQTLAPFLGNDNRKMLFRVVPDSGLGDPALGRLVNRVRALGSSVEGTWQGSSVQVGGMPAASLDYVAIMLRWMPKVFGLVIVGAVLVLAISFGGIVVAVKAVLLDLFSAAAAIGLATLVFMHGLGASLMGVDGPVQGVFPGMPLVVFCAVFGVSMDYEVFLISRIASARRSESGETEAIVHGISHTGAVITFAAAIMILVFGSFAGTGFLPAKMLGFTLATAVFLDATLVRIVMSSALMRLAGRWNWWPGQ